MIKLIRSLNLKSIVLIIGLIGTFLSIASYMLEFLFKIKPCVLCLYQRYIYILLIVISTLSFLKAAYHKRFHYRVLVVCLAIVFVEGIIAFYNIGVEQKVFQGLKACQIDNYSYSSIEELTSNLRSSGSLSSCSEPGFSIYGVTLAEVNFIVSFIIFILIGVKLLYECKHE